MDPIFLATIKDAAPVFDDSTCVQFDAHCRRMEGQKVEIIVRKWRARRSLNQNAYFHGVVLKMLQEVTGYAGAEGMDELKDILEDKFLRVPTKLGYRTRESEDLNTKEFEDFLEEIRLWAAVMFEVTDLETGEVKPFVIPLPNQTTFTGDNHE